jgi:hypothetical protein
VAQDEEAAGAARTIEMLLAQSRRRDAVVAQVKRRLAAKGRSHARSYSAVGYVQSSAHSLEGRKLYALLGSDGSTLAFLDIPPGLDIDPVLAQRVGVRGESHYSEDLGTQLITVRDIERMDLRR